MMNGYDNETYASIKQAATELADLFEDNSEVLYDDGTPWEHPGDDKPFQHLITEEGLEMMGDVFGNIREEHRGDVFTSFLYELEDRGIEYDIEQFKEDA